MHFSKSNSAAVIYSHKPKNEKEKKNPSNGSNLLLFRPHHIDLDTRHTHQIRTNHHRALGLPLDTIFHQQRLQPGHDPLGDLPRNVRGRDAVDAEDAAPVAVLLPFARHARQLSFDAFGADLLPDVV